MSAISRLTLAAALGVLLVAIAGAQVPADIAAQNQALGDRIDVASAIKTYSQVEESPPYQELQITRDLVYGTDPHYRLDVFAPRGSSATPRTVLIFATGGGFTRRIDLPGGAPFYDNVVLWAAKHGFIGVNFDRRHFHDHPWQVGPQDISAAIGYVHANIARYGGDARRVIFLGHAFGGTQLVSYLAHPEYWCCHDSPGIVAAALISAPFNLPPQTTAPAGAQGSNPLFDPAHGDLTGLRHITMPIFIGSPQYDGAQQQRSAMLLQRELCDAGHCPVVRSFADHNHLSVMFSFNTADQSASGAVLEWIHALGY